MIEGNWNNRWFAITDQIEIANFLSGGEAYGYDEDGEEVSVMKDEVDDWSQPNVICRRCALTYEKEDNGHTWWEHRTEYAIGDKNTHLDPMDAIGFEKMMSDIGVRFKDVKEIRGSSHGNDAYGAFKYLIGTPYEEFEGYWKAESALNELKNQGI